MVSVFVHNLPLRSLSRVASDYFSDSVVCIEILRPLRPLREIKIRVFCSHAKTAKSAEIYSLSYFTLALEWSQTSLRQECAESFIHPLPPAGYSRLSQGEKTDPSQPSPVWEGVVTTDLCPISRTLYSPSLTGRARSSEEALNVLLCLGRGALPSETRGLDGVGPEGPWLGPFPKKPLHPSLHAAGRGNPRIVKARSSHEIRCEHE